jgi:hypothetical protein
MAIRAPGTAMWPLLVHAPDPFELGLRDFEGVSVLGRAVEAGSAETSVAVFVMSGAVAEGAAGVVKLELTYRPALFVGLSRELDVVGQGYGLRQDGVEVANRSHCPRTL